MAHPYRGFLIVVRAADAAGYYEYEIRQGARSLARSVVTYVSAARAEGTARGLIDAADRDLGLGA